MRGQRTLIEPLQSLPLPLSGYMQRRGVEGAAAPLRLNNTRLGVLVLVGGARRSHACSVGLWWRRGG